LCREELALMRPWLVALAIYVAATGLMGRDVLATLETHIASDPGDPLLNAAILAWNATHVPWTEAWFQFPIFYPTRDALTLSEHLLGLSVVASPFFWLTGSPAVAYNLALLVSYPLCGLAMYALAWRLTRSSPAAFVAGLAFAFAPYRVSQLPHIQMLAMFWAPLALLGLHAFTAGEAPAGPPAARSALQTGAYAATDRQSGTGSGRAGSAAGGAADGRWCWLALFSACWALQGAANGYMLVYFSVFVGAWVVWFLGARRRWRAIALAVSAVGIAALPLVPILYRYIVAHRELGLSRNLGEIAAFGADVAAPLCAAPALSWWGWLRVACAPEGELFPGLAPLVLGSAAVLFLKPWSRGAAETSIASAYGGGRERSTRTASSRHHIDRVRRTVRRMAGAMAVLFLGIAVSAWIAGPWRIDLGWLRASASSADKPLSTALALLLIAFLLSDRFRSAVARGSVLTFYAGAAFVCWVLSWGPFPRLGGVPVLYQAPYAWLLQLPAVDALRAPARFWMLTVLCLSVIAGVVLARLLRGRSRRVSAAIVSVASCGLLIDGWAMIPAVPLPAAVADAATLRGAPVLVAPAGDLFRDAATVYHAVAGGWTAINGYSGYEPGYYEALRTLSHAGSDAQYEPFLRRGALHVADNRGVTRLASGPGPAIIPLPPGRRLEIISADASCSAAERRYAVDSDIDSVWVCGVQDTDHHITADLGSQQDVAAVVHALGSAGAAFPRHLLVETSRDASTWEAGWEGSPAALVLAAAIQEPRQTRVLVTFAPRPARYVRLRQLGRHERNYWAIAEIEVWGGRE
jgi:hypothetical protein